MENGHESQNRSLVEANEESPIVYLLKQAEDEANYSGGSDYIEGLSDRASSVFTHREAGATACVDVRFQAERSRKEPGADPQLTIYSMVSSFYDEIEHTALPTIALKAANEFFKINPIDREDNLFQCLRILHSMYYFDSKENFDANSKVLFSIDGLLLSVIDNNKVEFISDDIDFNRNYSFKIDDSFNENFRIIEEEFYYKEIEMAQKYLRMLLNKSIDV